MKTVVFVVQCFVLNLTMGITTPLLADECDPSKILIQDSAQRTSVIYEQLGIKEKTNESTRTAEHRSGSFSIPEIVVLSAAQSKEFSAALQNKFNLNFTGQYQYAEAYLQLSDAARKAYKDCLEAKTKHVYLTPAVDIMDSQDTFVEIKIEHYITNAPVDVSTTVDGGAKLQPDQPEQFKMYPGGKINVRFHRNLDAPFTLLVQAGSEAETLEIPARDQFRYVRELRYSKNAVWGHAGNGVHETHQLCIEIEAGDDAVLIPGSESLITPVRSIGRGGQFRDQPRKPSAYDPKKVCGEGESYDDGTKGVDIKVCGLLVASVTAKIPRNEGNSKFGMQPSYAANGTAACKL
jgi:hypothetical protein